MFHFISFTDKFVKYKAKLKKLIEHKKRLVEGKIEYSFNADEIEKILDKSEDLNDDVQLTEFKIQKEVTNLLNAYTESEKQTDKQYSKEFEYIKSNLYSDYMRLTE